MYDDPIAFLHRCLQFQFIPDIIIAQVAYEFLTSLFVRVFPKVMSRMPCWILAINVDVFTKNKFNKILNFSVAVPVSSNQAECVEITGDTRCTLPV